MTSYFSLCIGVFVTNVDWHPICVIGFSSVTITSFRSRTVFILSVLYLAVQFSTYAETPVNVTVSMSVLSVATNIVRILRNICSGSKQNKQVVVSKGIIRCVGVLVRFHVRSLASAKTSTSGAQEKWLGPNGMNSSFRLPCNSCSMWRQGVLLRFGMRCGLSSSQTVLRYASHGIPSSFLMKHYSHNTKLTSYAIAALYNLVNYQESTPREFAHLEYVVKSRDVMHLVFSRGLPDNECFALGRYSSRNVFAGVSLDYSSHGTHSSLSFIHNASVYRYAQLLVDELLFTCIACSAPPPLLLASKSRRKPISPVGRSSLSGSPVVDSPQRPFVLLLWCVHFQIAVTSSFRR